MSVEINITNRQFPFFSEVERKLLEYQIVINNGVFIYPTETFYALGCLATQFDAVSLIYQLKKRSKSLPLLVLVSNWDMLNDYIEPLNDNWQNFLNNYWPGSLTVILPVKDKLAKNLNTKDNNLGFRIVPSEITKEIIDLCKVPLVGTSANITGKIEVEDTNSAKSVFDGQVDLYINAGRKVGNKPSTIIKMIDKDTFKIIRIGVIKFGDEKAGSELLINDFIKK